MFLLFEFGSKHWRLNRNSLFYNFLNMPINSCLLRYGGYNLVHHDDVFHFGLHTVALSTPYFDLWYKATSCTVTFLHVTLCFTIKEWVSFFLGSWGMNRSAGQTNHVNREAVLGWFVCSALRFIPHEPRKKDAHSLYLQCFQQGLFLKFSEKSYWFKFPQYRALNFIWCISYCTCDSAQPTNFLLTLFIGNWTENF